MTNTYSYRVTSILITSPKMASHEASTTPTALIARLQLLACTSAHEYQGTGIVILSEIAGVSSTAQ